MATTTAMATEVAPEEVGLDPGRLARLDAYLDGFVDSGRHKGSLLAITRGGRIAHVSHRGQRDAEAGLPVEPDTIWRIYSMTKPITSVAAMMLYEEGALSLFDPVAKFIPSFDDLRVYRRGMAAAPVTVRAAEPMLVWHLLTHTSGLTYGFQQANAVDEAYRAARLLPRPAARARPRLAPATCWAGLPLLFEPGAEWNYSVSTDVLGRVVEVVSGQSLDEFFAERIFAPLGMTDTGLLGLRGRPPAADRALRPRPGRRPPRSRTRASTSISTERPKLLAGGARAGLDGRRLPPLHPDAAAPRRARRRAPARRRGRSTCMTANHLPGNATLTEFGRPLLDLVVNEGYGFGLGLSPLVDPIAAKTLSAAGEYRWEGAAGTAFWVDPAADMTVLFFTQVLFGSDDVWIGMRPLVYQALVGG